MAGSSSSGGDDDYMVRETDPSGHYVRYSKLIDEGDHKEVYLGFDNINCREVAWCKKFLQRNNYTKLVNEAKSLKSFDHQNIIKCYHFWAEARPKIEINMITELYSGNLKDYIQKHQVKENSPAIKRWCQQILTGLDFLHSQNKPIIHNDLKCENIFVVGNSGTIKLGDLSVATILEPKSSPEYDVDYTRWMERSEMYCVGLCALQMVNKDAETTDLLKYLFLAPRTAPSGSTSSVPSAGAVFQPRRPAINTNAAAESEGDSDDSNTAAASKKARLMAE